MRKRLEFETFKLLGSGPPAAEVVEGRAFCRTRCVVPEKGLNDQHYRDANVVTLVQFHRWPVRLSMLSLSNFSLFEKISYHRKYRSVIFVYNYILYL